MLKRCFILTILLSVVFCGPIAASSLSFDDLKERTDERGSFEKKFFELIHHNNNDENATMRVVVAAADNEEIKKARLVGLNSVSLEGDEIVSKWTYYNSSFVGKSATITIHKITPADD